MQLSLSSRDKEKDTQGTWDGIKRWVQKNVKISPYPNKIEMVLARQSSHPHNDRYNTAHSYELNERSRL